MILVDTSVWIEIFRRKGPMDLGADLEIETVVTCLPVIQEVLQGFDDQRAFSIARDAMYAFPIVESPVSEEVFELAIDLYRSARRSGHTVRSGVDCLIAGCAVRNSLPVLHHDRDFDALAKVSPLEVIRC